MDGYITWKKIIAIALVLVLSASIFSFYGLENDHIGSTKLNIVVLPIYVWGNSYVKFPIYVYNQFGEPDKR